MNSTPFDLYSLVVLLVLAVILPLIGIWDFQRLKASVAAGKANARTKAYKWTLVWQWGLMLGLGGWWIQAGRGLAPLGLLPVASGWQWLAICLGMVAVILQIWQMVSTVGDSEKLEKARSEIGELRDLGPQTENEFRLFSALSITAGVCEEILYRGLLMATIAPLTGTWMAVVLTSIIFGLGHAYQGMAGIGKTALVGLIMALLTVFSGSIFVAILLHVVVDFTVGRIMFAAREDELSGRLPHSSNCEQT
ncbi:MAG: CPBP family intramembrane metalloprotease [bacterium]|nr:CPBP family intramembrane metalloprotease [bacterium]